MPVDLEAIRRVINPPARIESFAHLEELIHDENCHTVVEGPFFDEIVGIVRTIRDEEVPGDLVVAGVWKGGSSLYVNALNHHFGLGRRLWLADTFTGFLNERIRHERDREALRRFSEELKFHDRFPTPADIRRLFESCGLWDDSVSILAGPLEETLHGISSDRLALVHIDVDFYEPTYAALEQTWDRLSPGGYVIVDDYGVEMFNCRDAVDEFRARHGITDPIRRMSDWIAWWRKPRHA